MDDRGAPTTPARPRHGRLAPIALLALAVLIVPPAAADHPPLPGANVFLGRVCKDTAGLVADITTSGYDNTGNGDVPLGDDAINGGADYVYFGAEEHTTKLVVKLVQSGTTGTVSWSYWGGAWKTLTVEENSNHFRRPNGNYEVRFSPPSDWVKRQIDATTCPGSFFFVRLKTDTNYGTVPLAEMVHGLQFNLRLSVTDELDAPLTGLAATNFNVTAGSTNEIMAFRATSTPSVYEFGLRTRTGDAAYEVRAARPGYVPSPPLYTRALNATMADYDDSPLVVPFALKVVVRDEGGTAVTGASVKHNGVSAAAVRQENAYFNHTASGPLSVAKAGFAGIDLALDTQLASVAVGIHQQTVVTLGGVQPCAAGSSVPAGSSLTCHGLRRPSGSTNPTSTNGAPSSSNSFWQSGGPSGSYVVTNGSTIFVPAESEFEPVDPASAPPGFQLSVWGYAAAIAFLLFVAVLLFLRPRKRAAEADPTEAEDPAPGWERRDPPPKP